MGKDKEKTLNPAAAHRKAEKQKALKKGKAVVAAQRTERLAHRNPNRLQSQIDDLKALESSSGSLSARDKRTLQDLEREVGRIHKAKDAKGRPSERGSAPQAGLQAPSGHSYNRNSILGKRGRDDTRNNDTESSDTDEDARNIPMPRDTPPPLPIPKSRGHQRANVEGDHVAGDEESQRPTRPDPVPTKTVYESKPQVRDLRKEAAAFLPSAVQRKMALSTGQIRGKYLEADELEALEKQGYKDGTTKQSGLGSQSNIGKGHVPKPVHVEEADDEDM